MADNTPALPAGFVIVNSGVHDDAPPLPAGFQLFPTSRANSHPSFEEGEKLLNAQDQKDKTAGVNGALGAGLTGFANGIPIVGPAILGGIQRAAAGIGSMIDGDPYADKLKAAQDLTSQAQTAHPIATEAGQIAGGVAGTAPLIAAAPAAFGAGAASLPIRMAAGAGTGSVLGAADGGVRGGVPGALVGAGAGMAFGAAGPFAGDLAASAGRSIATHQTQGEAARIAGTSRPAVDVVARALAADNATGATNANIAAAGPAAMLADAGPSTQTVLDTAIQRGGPGAGQAGQRIEARSNAAATDIHTALDQALGNPPGMVQPLNDLRTQTAPARAAAYDAAYNAPINYADPRGQALENMIRTRVPGPIIDRANNLMRINGEQSQQIHANVAPDGTVTFERLPDVRQIDYITRALNDVSQRGDGNGALGGNTQEGRAYGNLSRQLRGLTGSLVPEYNTALTTAAEPIAQREAALFGQRLMSPTVPRDEVEGFVTGLSQPELQSLRAGIRAKVAETLSNVKRTVTDPNVDARQGVAALKELSSDASREKLALVLGQQPADNMFAAIDQASHSFELRSRVATNSRTYARQAAERAVEQATGPGVIDNAASGRPLASVQSFLQNLLGAGKQAQLGRQDEAWGHIADLLTQPAGQAGGSFLQAMQGAAGALPTIDRNAARVSGAVTRGVASFAPQSGRLVQKATQ